MTRKVLPMLAALLAALLWSARGIRADPGALADSFYRRLFQTEAAREVFGMEEDEILAVFGETDGGADPV